MPHHPPYTYIFSQGKSKVNRIYRCRSCAMQLGSGEQQRHKDNTVSQTSIQPPLCIQPQLHLTWDLFHQQIFEIISTSLNIWCVATRFVHDKHSAPWADEWLNDKWVKHRRIRAWSCPLVTYCLPMIPLSWGYVILNSCQFPKCAMLTQASTPLHGSLPSHPAFSD